MTSHNRNIVTNSKNDFVSQFISNIFSNNDDFESILFVVDIESKFHFMSTKIQKTHASKSIDKTNTNNENDKKSNEKNDKKR